jgi:lysine-specific demethylase/histidyl-hydroxylase NO66
VISEPGLRRPGFRLVKAGEKLDASAYSADVSWRPSPFTGVADVPRVLAEVDAGATVVLQGLHLIWHPLAVYCRELEAFLGHPAQANAYLTPRRSQGLPVHHDTHDVFVLQVAGIKRWLVYEPVLELPLRDQRYTPELGAPGETVLDVVLEAGDTLYLPRGWLHQALTSDEDSLHLTIGVNVYSWLDAVKAALAECADDVDFRREAPGSIELADELVARLQERLAPEDVARRRRERFLKGRRPLLGGQLSQLRALDRLNTNTLLERRDTVSPHVDVSDDEVTLSYEAGKIVFPAAVRPEIEFIAETDEPFRASDLPGELDDESRLVLVGRLVREGFVQISEAGRDDPSQQRDGGAGE